jgi:hypothetical protein
MLDRDYILPLQCILDTSSSNKEVLCYSVKALSYKVNDVETGDMDYEYISQL